MNSWLQSSFYPLRPWLWAENTSVFIPWGFCPVILRHDWAVLWIFFPGTLQQWHPFKLMLSLSVGKVMGDWILWLLLLLGQSELERVCDSWQLEDESIIKARILWTLDCLALGLGLFRRHNVGQSLWIGVINITSLGGFLCEFVVSSLMRNSRWELYGSYGGTKNGCQHFLPFMCNLALSHVPYG